MSASPPSCCCLGLQAAPAHQGAAHVHTCEALVVVFKHMHNARPPARLAQLPGTSGVELLTNCMNNYFTRVINMILAFDGDVVKFAGGCALHPCVAAVRSMSRLVLSVRSCPAWPFVA